MTNAQTLERPGVALGRDDIARAREAAQATGRTAVDVLEEQLGLPPQDYLALLGASLHFATVDMQTLHALAPAFDLLPFAEAVQRNCVVVRAEGGLIAVFADPFDLGLGPWLEARLGPLQWRLAHRADLAAYLALREESLRALDEALQVEAEQTETNAQNDLTLASIAQDASPAVKMVNSTIYDAMKAGASDIHLESLPNALHVKYRIDGVLSSVTSVTGREAAEQVVSRIKVMAELDIAERRVPQDGRFKLSLGGRPVDFRVSVIPTIHGEDVVIRILDKRALTDQFQSLRLDLLGFDPATLADIRALVREPYGMFLVTGPTGSGKTTTLYAALSEIHTGQDKIITIEDPVEYQLAGIMQIPVNEKKGLTFARGLRSILRHDPDKILVGEMRDPDTAQIAVQSALTGHLVFTTVHANNVFDVIGRFLHMGLEPYSFVSALNGILAQRLVRLVCPACAAPEEADGVAFQKLEPWSGARQAHFVRGRGCGQCRGTGYKGRHAVGEVLRLTDEIRELISARAPIRTVKEAARKGGTRFLRHSALALAAQGRTTLEEVNRVTLAQ